MILWKEDPAPAPPQARQEAQGRAMKTVRVARISAIAFGLFVVAASATQSAEFASGIPRIVDGDTVQIGGTKIRFAGIDAPETDQVCLDAKGEKWACGVTARDELIKYSAGRSWDCDLVGSDRYGRSLGKCFIEGGDISAWMVRSGWALSFVRYSQDYDRDEEIAREANQAALAKGGTYSFAYEGEQLKTGRTALVAGFNLCNDFATFVCENRSSVGTERRAVPAQRASSREGRSSGRRIRQTVGRHHLLPGERSERVVRAGASETAVAGQGMRGGEDIGKAERIEAVRKAAGLANCRSGNHDGRCGSGVHLKCQAISNSLLVGEWCAPGLAAGGVPIRQRFRSAQGPSLRGQLGEQEILEDDIHKVGAVRVRTSVTSSLVAPGTNFD